MHLSIMDPILIITLKGYTRETINENQFRNSIFDEIKTNLLNNLILKMY